MGCVISGVCKIVRELDPGILIIIQGTNTDMTCFVSLYVIGILISLNCMGVINQCKRLTAMVLVILSISKLSKAKSQF